MLLSHEKLFELEQIFYSIEIHMAKLQDSLTEEKSALEKQDLEAIAQSTFNKQQQFDKLNSYSDSLKIFLENENLPFCFESCQQLLQSAPSTLIEKWNHLVKKIQQAQEANLLNGMLVMGLKNYNEKLLHILTQTTQTYHPTQTNSQPVSTRERKV